jgi:two-component system chemotaxis response regulator CheB
MVRVLIAEDSAVIRETLAYVLDEDPSIHVVGTAQNGLEAAAQTERLKPDVVVMDVHMPQMNGFEATRWIMERVPTPIVMVSASLNQDEVAMTFKALEAGALTMLNKPGGFDHPEHAESVQRLVTTVKLMAQVKVVRRWPRRAHPPPLTPPPPVVSRTLRLVAIGASTGGPQVIAEILARLPANLGVPLLVVQHIAPGFISGFTRWLDQQTRLTVKLAESGESVSAGTVYIAPDGSQMGITKAGRILLTRESAGYDFCPSASYVFESVAEAYNRSAMGILLTGMGRDGAQGLLRLREVRGVTIAQDEESSVVFGMPGAAISLGAAEHVLPPVQIAEMIRTLAGG